MRIYKYSLGSDPPIGLPLLVLMPEAARQLRIEYQGNELCIWAEVIPSESMVERKYMLLPTGAEVAPDMRYQTTLFQGPNVWHLYRI